ncbi:serine/threonine-protein kinase drp72 [Streptomyces viridosporus ATCC 14672]|uniref:Serine/threonine-protein kinase drp72 n=1 Tax=Streptomyces viridosporus (strain ATCC 14672 / DSM 40746 / JCM 4963 / KCTC 9882 / NRRL B-12104 / FH 1290) TaxID=566461 RepID=D6A396_STRV1|nr:serine/threonine-protein kinase drp72 [Streptomyces viridosporus ATCC 14672]
MAPLRFPGGNRVLTLALVKNIAGQRESDAGPARRGPLPAR